jgi:hypothetical protein
MTKEKIRKYEDKLLKQGKYLKSCRSSAIIFSIIIIISQIILIDKFPPEKYAATTLFLSFMFLFMAWECTLKLRHIQSIKYYREKEEK